MGIKISPLFAQSVMDSLFGPDGNVEVFMDDIAYFYHRFLPETFGSLTQRPPCLSLEKKFINMSKCTLC